MSRGFEKAHTNLRDHGDIFANRVGLREKAKASGGSDPDVIAKAEKKLGSGWLVGIGAVALSVGAVITGVVSIYWVGTGWVVVVAFRYVLGPNQLGEEVKVSFRFPRRKK